MSLIFLLILFCVAPKFMLTLFALYLGFLAMPYVIGVFVVLLGLVFDFFNFLF